MQLLRRAFLDSIIATPSAYEGRYAGCSYFLVLCLVLYIAGFCHASGAVEAPFLSMWGGLCSLAETCEMLVKSCGPELVNQSK